MKEDILFTVVFFAGIGAFALLTFIAVKISDLIYNIVSKRRERQYPEFFELLKEVNEKGDELCREHNAVIPGLIKKIDQITAELKYLPAEHFEKKTAELEELRQQLYEANAKSDNKQKELSELRAKAHNYVKENNLKFAQKWGW